MAHAQEMHDLLRKEPLPLPTAPPAPHTHGHAHAAMPPPPTAHGWKPPLSTRPHPPPTDTFSARRTSDTGNAVLGRGSAPHEDAHDCRRRRPGESRHERRLSGRPASEHHALAQAPALSRPSAHAVRHRHKQHKQQQAEGRQPAASRSRLGQDAASDDGRMSVESAAARLEGQPKAHKPPKSRDGDGGAPHASRPTKAVGHAMTSWVRVWSSGESSVLRIEKAQLIANFGIQARDFYVLESAMTRSQCCILCRAHCIILNLVYIRCVITAQYVLVVPPDDDQSSVFLSKLKERINQPFVHLVDAAAQHPPAAAGRGDRRHRRHKAKPGAANAAAGGAAETVGLRRVDRSEDDFLLPSLQGEEELPFELKALEVCLDELAFDLSRRTKDVEGALRPVLEKIYQMLRPEYLDIRRKLKTKVQGLRSVTQSVCQALEEHLEGDDNLMKFRLTGLHEQEVVLLKRVSKYPIMEAAESEDELASTSSCDRSIELSRIEMLLEWYFMHFDNIYDKLQDLVDTLSGSESVVNIRLDAHQNKLLSISVMAQGFALINYFAVGVMGFFTMNLHPNPPTSENWGDYGKQTYFVNVLIPSMGGAYILFAAIVYFLMHNNILVLS